MKAVNVNNVIQVDNLKGIEIILDEKHLGRRVYLVDDYIQKVDPLDEDTWITWAKGWYEVSKSEEILVEQGCNLITADGLEPIDSWVTVGAMADYSNKITFVKGELTDDIKLEIIEETTDAGGTPYSFAVASEDSTVFYHFDGSTWSSITESEFLDLVESTRTNMGYEEHYLNPDGTLFIDYTESILSNVGMYGNFNSLGETIYFFAPVPDGMDTEMLEKYLCRERSDAFAWVDMRTSERYEYTNTPIKDLSTIERNDELSTLYGKELYDITCEWVTDITSSPMIDYSELPTISEAQQVFNERASFFIVYQNPETEDEDPTPVKALFSIEDYEEYLINPVENTYLVKVIDSLYRRYSTGESYVILSSAGDFDEIDRTHNFCSSEIRLAIKGFECGVDESIIYSVDTLPNYYEGSSGMLPVSYNGAIKSFLDTSGVASIIDNGDFTYTISIKGTVELDVELLDLDTLSIRILDITENAQKMDSNADTLMYSKPNLFRRDYTGTQEVELYTDKSDTLSTLADMGYKLEVSLVNGKTNRNMIDKIITDLLASVVYTPDDKIVFKSDRQFILYQGGKEGFSSGEYTRLVVNTEATDDTQESVTVPNNEILVWKGRFYQNRSGQPQTYTHVYGGSRINPEYISIGDPLNHPGSTRSDGSAPVVPYYSALWAEDHPDYDPTTSPSIPNKRISTITGEEFYTVIWPCPIDLNSETSPPYWYEIKLEEYINAYTDYRAAIWEDRAFTAVAEVMNEGSLSLFYTSAAPQSLFTSDDLIWIEDETTGERHLGVKSSQDTYKRYWIDEDNVEHEVVDTVPEEAVGVKATGYKLAFDYSEGSFKMAITVPLNEDIHDKAVYSRVDSNMSQEYIFPDFVFGVVPKCDAGSEKVNGQIVHIKGEVPCRAVAGVGLFSYGNVDSVIYDPYQGVRVYDEEGDLAVDYFEGTITYNVSVIKDKQVISIISRLADNWEYLSDDMKAGMCAASHKLSFNFAAYQVSAHNIKNWYGSYKLNPGWKFYGDTAEIRYDDKEVQFNLELKYTPCTLPETDPKYYEYTNIPIVNLPVPMNKFIRLVGHTSWGSFPAPVGVTINNKGDMVLEENVDNFYLSGLYRYIKSDLDFISLHIPDFSELAVEDPDFFNLLKSKIHSIEIIPSI